MGKLYPGRVLSVGTGAPSMGYGVSITGVSVAFNGLVCLKEADQMRQHNFKSYITLGESNAMGHVGTLPCGRRPTAQPKRHLEHGISGGGSDTLQAAPSVLNIQLAFN